MKDNDIHSITLIVLLSQLVSVIALPLRFAAFPAANYRFDDLQTKCFNPMIIAKNKDNMITHAEVPSFVKALAIVNNISDPKLNKSNFGDLPSQIIIEYNNLLCVDRDRTNCAAGIDVSAAININNAQEEEKKFLEKVCKEFVVTMRKVAGPSDAPSMVPSSEPSYLPSTLPTDSPSAAPSFEPSSEPSIHPSDLPSKVPSIAPSDKPSEITLESATITFGVLNTYGLSAEEIDENVGGSKNLIEAVFSDFSKEIESSLFTQTIGGDRNLRISDVRLLGVEFASEDILAKVTDMKNNACPPDLANDYKDKSPRPQCQHMNGIISYMITGDTNPTTTKTIITNKAEREIQNGLMMEKVPEGLGGWVFYSVIGDTVTYIPIAAITGIAIGAALIGLIAGRLLVKRRIRRKNVNEQYDGLNEARSTMDDDDFTSNKDSLYSPASYKGLAEESMYRREAHDLSLENSVASSSNAGSSGWSSSAGISSLNTGSVDSAEYFGSSLAAIGAASNISKRYKTSVGSSDIYPIVGDIDESSMSESDVGMSELGTDDESNIGHGTRQFAIREELEHAIQSGDWSLVGATAAIIAQSPADFLNTDVNSTISSNLSSVGTSPRKNERAAELDRLVEVGDWEGVVLAAAKFETEGDKDFCTEGSASISEGQQFLANRSHAQLSDGNSTTSPSVSTNISESASNNVKRAEIRAEVEALVRRVVPDEIDNVDEMMHQFKGREEELVETLRTMQERSIAARQREAMRRNAKREARRLAKLNKPPSNRRVNLNRISVHEKKTSLDDVDMDASFHSASSNTDNNCGESKISDSSKENSRNSILTPNRSALDHAIKIGDWEAVGRTAEQLGDGTLSDTTSEYISADENSMISTSQSHPDAERASELDGLIDQGDWSAVVAAASRFATADMKEMQKKEKSVVKQISQSAQRNVKTKQSEFDDAVSQSTEAKDTKTRKEEEDALAQAEIWMTIAAQSKKGDSSATKGASDAADWAISRSLKQIQASSKDKHETQSASSSCDDKSV